MNSIINDTYALSLPNGRMPGSRGHKKAARYIRRQYNALGLQPYGDQYTLPYMAPAFHYGRQTIQGRPMRNIVGVIPGHDRSLAPIVIGAHYDSVGPFPSADDNATSVAAMLYAAAKISASPLQRDVIIAAFDGEEPPYYLTPGMGSTRFVEDHIGDDPVHLAIIMDLIGHPSPLPMVHPHLTAVTGIESNPNLANILDGGNLPTFAVENELVGDMSDHHGFRVNGHPFLFLSSGEWADYHTYRDTPDKIDYDKVLGVADEVVRFAVEADTLDLGYTQHHDITDLTMATATEHLGEGIIEALGGRPDTIVPAIRNAMTR